MSKPLCLSCWFLLTTAVLFAQEAKTTRSTPANAAKATATEIGPEAEPIRELLRSYIEAFNKHDAKAVAALWMPKGIYVDRSTGERVEGREALEKDFATTFKEKPSARLSGSLQSVRFIRPEVVSAEGEAVETPKEVENRANKTAFSAIFVRQDGRWLIDSIQESDLPAPQPASASLADLEWMLGHWVDKSDQARVDTICRWSPRHAFLVRSFTIKTGQGGEADQSMKVPPAVTDRLSQHLGGPADGDQEPHPLPPRPPGDELARRQIRMDRQIDGSSQTHRPVREAGKAGRLMAI
jgi:uncharacterized protein (TIGR02246 family)